jgi:Tol biopolymer transport system component/DNA-binding winged helix-turn-helix (wHTH) protein
MAGKLQFGVYELDCNAMELRKDGVPIRLQEQPLRVLKSLVERPGEIVTREELRERIWGKDTFVDFEQSLNKAVNRLREALDDDAGQPGFVETVPRRGYRFIAPVTRQNPPQPTEPMSHLNPASVIEARPPRPRHRVRTVALLATACSLVAMGIGAALLWKRTENRRPAENRLITSAATCCPRLSRDGKLLLYVSSDSRGVSHVWVQQTVGGEAIQVTNGPEGETMADFSPDGTRIVFVSDGSLYLKPTFSGEPKLIAKAVSAQHPLFSPTGEQVSFLDGKNLIAMIVSVDSGEPKPVNSKRNLAVRAWPGWSPKGDEVVFEAFDQVARDRPLRWWIVHLATGETRPLDLPGDNFAHSVFEAWIRGKDGVEWIIYSEGTGEQWKLFRVRVLEHGQIGGKPEQVLSGTALLGQANVSISDDGKIVYFISNFRQSIYEIPIGSRGEAQGPALQLPLPDGDAFFSPVLSRDGRWMAYDAWRPGKSNTVIVRDLRNSTDRVLDVVGLTSHAPPSSTNTESRRAITVSPDGSHVIFGHDCQGNLKWLDGLQRPCSFVMSVAGGKSERICEMCDARGFSTDGSVVLFQKYNQDVFDKPPPRIVAVDMASKTERVFLSSPDRSLWHAFFSWDDRWVVFKRLLEGEPEKSELLIAPVRNGVAGKETEWIPITDGLHNDDKPQFSPDGNLVYFTSTRDGYLCIWSQKLNPATKKPVGGPIAFEHFHNASGRDAAYDPSNSNLSVAKDKMVINLPQYSVTIWMTQIE